MPLLQDLDQQQIHHTMPFKVTVEIDQERWAELQGQGYDDQLLKDMVYQDVKRGWLPQVGHSHLIIDLEIDPC